MKKFLRKHLILLICLGIIWVTIMSSIFIKVPYNLTAPASISEVKDVIKIDNQAELDGSINTVSVYSYEEISALSYLIGRLNPYVTIDETIPVQNVSYEEMVKGGRIQKSVSLYNAVIAGYQAAGYPIDYSYQGYIIHFLTTFADEQLQLGDIIIECNHQKVTNEFSVSAALHNSTYPLEANKLSLVIIRNSERIPLTISGIYTKNEKDEDVVSYGFSIYPYNIPNTGDGAEYPKFSFKSADSIGPSGGLMQSFYVYEKLTGAKLSKDLVIVGTGTVDINGNAGKIGGIAQKVIAAELSHADIFFIPVLSNEYEKYSQEENYLEAMESYNRLHNPHMIMQPVANLQDIIDFLTEYQGGKK